MSHPSLKKEHAVPGSLVQKEFFNDSWSRKRSPSAERRWQASPLWWRSDCCGAKVDTETDGAFTMNYCRECQGPCELEEQL